MLVMFMVLAIENYIPALHLEAYPGVVTPAKAGVQFCECKNWIPAFAGMIVLGLAWLSHGFVNLYIGTHRGIGIGLHDASTGAARRLEHGSMRKNISKSRASQCYTSNPVTWQVHD